MSSSLRWGGIVAKKTNIEDKHLYILLTLVSKNILAAFPKAMAMIKWDDNLKYPEILSALWL